VDPNAGPAGVVMPVVPAVVVWEVKRRGGAPATEAVPPTPAEPRARAFAPVPSCPDRRPKPGPSTACAPEVRVWTACRDGRRLPLGGDVFDADTMPLTALMNDDDDGDSWRSEVHAFAPPGDTFISSICAQWMGQINVQECRHSIKHERKLDDEVAHPHQHPQRMQRTNCSMFFMRCSMLRRASLLCPATACASLLIRGGGMSELSKGDDGYAAAMGDSPLGFKPCSASTSAHTGGNRKQETRNRCLLHGQQQAKQAS
jgi:hypothetical protein